MYAIFSKTFGGLSAKYYRHKVVSALIVTAAPNLALLTTGEHLGMLLLVLSLLNTLLYPYARFAVDSAVARIVGFLFEDAVFIVPVIPMLFVRLVVFLTCWMFTVFLMPVGLLLLYGRFARGRA